jgi:hypothetical protein
VRNGSVDIAFENTGNTTRIRSKGIPSKIGDVIVDGALRVVRCGVGESEPGEEFDVKSGGAIGPCRGTCFRYLKTDGKVAPYGSFSIGSDENGLSFIYIEMRSYDDAETEPLVVLLKWTSPEKKPNKALVPTPASVTPAADAPVAPDAGAAHL